MKAGITLSVTNLPQFDRGVTVLLLQQAKHNIKSSMQLGGLSPLSIQNYCECDFIFQQDVDQKRNIVRVTLFWMLLSNILLRIIDF